MKLLRACDAAMNCPCGRGEYALCGSCPYPDCSVHGRRPWWRRLLSRWLCGRAWRHRLDFTNYARPLCVSCGARWSMRKGRWERWGW